MDTVPQIVELALWVDGGHVGLASCMEAILRCILLIGEAS